MIFYQVDSDLGVILCRVRARRALVALTAFSGELYLTSSSNTNERYHYTS